MAAAIARTHRTALISRVISAAPANVRQVVGLTTLISLTSRVRRPAAVAARGVVVAVSRAVTVAATAADVCELMRRFVAAVHLLQNRACVRHSVGVNL